MSTNLQNSDKAGLEHWDATERNVDVPLESFEPLPGVRGFGRRAWHAMLTAALADVARPGASLLELGCGGSALLPYFANRLGFTVSGIDYSQGGIDMARRICAAHGVAPHLIRADFFHAPEECREAYDAVVSFGVVEHFTDTNATIEAFARFVRPGGKLITVVPNMRGLSGLGQRLLDRGIYDIHETIDPPRLRAAHEAAGLTVESCGYFLFNNFGVINPGLKAGRAKTLAFSALRALTGAAWSIESVTGRLPPNRVTSPYVVTVAAKPARAAQ
jgi:2-polyprenyl-3-methyl-5-hydroxy-6-metoxy-1,4-benzoquinol methylase